MTGLEIGLAATGIALPVLGATSVALVRMGRLLFVLDEVHQQVHTNGGKSMRDAVNRIEERQDTMAGQLDGVHQALTAHLAMPAGIAHEVV